MLAADLRRSSIHKRAMDPRDCDDSSDLEDIAELLQSSMEQETENPPWKLCFPHVLVATIVPFLFGYHLGFPILFILQTKSGVERGLAWQLSYGTLHWKKLFRQIKKKSPMKFSTIPLLGGYGYDLEEFYL